MDIHEAFLNFNNYNKPQAFFKFTLPEQMELSDELFIGFSTNQQGDRLKRSFHTNTKEQFKPALQNFMLFDSNGKFLGANYTSELMNGCLLITGNNQTLPSGDYLLMYDPMWQEGHKNAAYKSIQMNFWFPKGKI